MMETESTIAESLPHRITHHLPSFARLVFIKQADFTGACVVKVNFKS
jgi:hypothetical protein